MAPTLLQAPHTLAHSSIGSMAAHTLRPEFCTTHSNLELLSHPSAASGAEEEGAEPRCPPGSTAVGW